MVSTGSILETVLEVWRLITVTNLDVWETFVIKISNNLTFFFFFGKLRLIVIPATKVPGSCSQEPSIVVKCGSPDLSLVVDIGAAIDVVGAGPDLQFPVLIRDNPVRIRVLSDRCLHLDLIAN